MKIVDLSHTIESSPQDLPDFLRVDVSYSDHQAGAREFEEAFGVPPRLFRNGEGPAIERQSSAPTRAPTWTRPTTTTRRSRVGRRDHRRAAARMVLRARGRRRRPREGRRRRGHRGGDGAGHRARRAAISPRATSCSCGPAAMRSTASATTCCAAAGSPPRRRAGCTSAACASWGSTPGAGTGRSTSRPRRRSRATSPASSGRLTRCDLPYSQIERLVNLGALPPAGFTVACFPLKITGASAGPARVVAIFDG